MLNLWPTSLIPTTLVGAPLRPASASESEERRDPPTRFQRGIDALGVEFIKWRPLVDLLAQRLSGSILGHFDRRRSAPFAQTRAYVRAVLEPRPTSLTTRR